MAGCAGKAGSEKGVLITRAGSQGEEIKNTERGREWHKKRLELAG